MKISFFKLKHLVGSGQLVSKVLVNEGITISRELYFAILMDRKHNGPVIVASTQVGNALDAIEEYIRTCACLPPDYTGWHGHRRGRRKTP